MAPGTRIDASIPDQVKSLASRLYPDAPPEIEFHPQCFLSAGHFAGDDAARAAAFLDIANDESFDALWFGRGGYGSCRFAEDVLPRLTPAARDKLYLGYSDAGTLLAGLYKAGFPRLAHGPMPIDISRAGGAAAVERALAYMIEDSAEALEPHVGTEGPAVAFNIIILGHLIGTPLLPDLAGHVLMLEEISEYMYRIDRDLCQVTAIPEIRQAAGIRLGRCNGIPENDPDFVLTEEEVARHWCQVSGIPYLGRADIGHDAENKVVPFGPRPTA